MMNGIQAIETFYRGIRFRSRLEARWAKLFSAKLKEGDEYDALEQTICVNIINFNLFDCEDFHSHFQALEKNRHEPLIDKFAYRTMDETH